MLMTNRYSNTDTIYHYGFVDMRSFNNIFHFGNNQNNYQFLDMLLQRMNDCYQNNISYRKCMANLVHRFKLFLIFTDNDSNYRKPMYEKIGFDYHIEPFDKHNMAKNALFHLTNDLEFKDKFKVVNVNGFEMKDALFSSLRYICDFFTNKNLLSNLNLYFFTVNRQMVLTIPYMQDYLNSVNQRDLFLMGESRTKPIACNFYFNRYYNTPKFSGFEEVDDLDKYLLNHYHLNLSAPIFSSLSSGKTFHFYERLINDYQAMVGLNHCSPKIKLVDGYGMKKTANVLNKFMSLEHMFLAISEFGKKNDLINDVKKLIDVSKINRINDKIDIADALINGY